MFRTRYTMPIAVHLLLLRDNEILLLRRNNTGYEDGNYSVIAGHVEKGEEVMQAMAREAYEEANIDITRENLKVVGIMHRKTKSERIDFFLTAREWQGELRNKEPHKCDELAWYPLQNLPENTIPYVRQAIENFQAGKWFDSFGWS
ncbi:NUDIX hydrolase [Ktedonospora formicarum]|uniref:Nudix hydrolase domain-containing protein n=1 Tax=Ktedonospora formicarum TaxID=2778364 RepID=A0A8J3MQ34_9CHLR|nr:NUDIX domain-containing protein [Ktedonospora formicarum]GHO43555.1 hypothetical protein KSX_17180 [Ktedonospora formicarum]